jgi:hypothetical protein
MHMGHRWEFRRKETTRKTKMYVGIYRMRQANFLFHMAFHIQKKEVSLPHPVLLKWVSHR